MLSPTKLGFDRQTQRSSLTKPNKIGVEHQHVRISQTNMMEMIGMIGMNGMNDGDGFLLLYLAMSPMIVGNAI